MKKLNISADKLKWILEDEELDNTPLDFLTNVHSWLKEGIVADNITQEEYEEYIQEREEFDAENQSEEEEENEEENDE